MLALIEFAYIYDINLRILQTPYPTVLLNIQHSFIVYPCILLKHGQITKIYSTTPYYLFKQYVIIYEDYRYIFLIADTAAQSLQHRFG